MHLAQVVLVRQADPAWRTSRKRTPSSPKSAGPVPAPLRRRHRARHLPPAADLPEAVGCQPARLAPVAPKAPVSICWVSGPGPRRPPGLAFGPVEEHLGAGIGGVVGAGRARRWDEEHPPDRAVVHASPGAGSTVGVADHQVLAGPESVLETSTRGRRRPWTPPSRGRSRSWACSRWSAGPRRSGPPGPVRRPSTLVAAGAADELVGAALEPVLRRRHVCRPSATRRGGKRGADVARALREIRRGGAGPSSASRQARVTTVELCLRDGRARARAR